MQKSDRSPFADLLLRHPERRCNNLCCASRLLSETGFYTPPPLEGKIATDTFTPSPAPVLYKISGPMGGGFLYTTGAEAENSAVKLSKESVPPLYKISLPCWALFNRGGERNGGVCDICHCVARARARTHSRHTNDTRAFPQTKINSEPAGSGPIPKTEKI